MSTTAELIEVAEAAELLGVPVRTLRHRCAVGQISGAVKGDGGWRIPRAYDTRLHGVAAPEQRGLERLGEVAADKLADAQRKAGIVAEAEQFAASAVREGMNRSHALAAFCASKQIGHGTLYRWMQAWKDKGLEGLIDTRGKGKFETDTISDDAWEWFKSAWLDMRQPTVKMVWQNMRFHSQQHNLDWQIPSLRTMYEQIEKRIPMPSQVLFRQGEAAYDAQCAPYIMIDPDSIEPGEVWVGDHHQLNCMIRHRGEWTRPWLTCWQDRRSRAIVGHVLTDSPNQVTIMLAMRKGLDQYGPPKSVKIDNGRDYDSQMFTGVTKTQRRVLGKGYLDQDGVRGLYSMMGITVSFAIPYHPQSKPIERWFDTLDKQFTKSLRTYCGKDTARKPEDLVEYLKTNEAIEKAYTLETLAPVLDRYIAAFNSSAHMGAGMDGRSPNEVMSTREGRRVLVKGVVDLLCRVWSGELKVSKNGIRIGGLWYGQFNMDLMAHQGKKVRASYDPDDISSVQIYDAKTYHLITIADQHSLVAHGVTADEDARRTASAAKARAKKIMKQQRDASRTANMDLTSLTIEAMEHNSRPDLEPTAAPAMRPAATALDGQVVRVRQKQVARAVRKAAGAEQVTHVTELDVDWRRLKQDDAPDTTDYGFDFRKLKPKTESVDLKLFNG